MLFCPMRNLMIYFRGFLCRRLDTLVMGAHQRHNTRNCACELGYILFLQGKLPQISCETSTTEVGPPEGQRHLAKHGRMGSHSTCSCLCCLVGYGHTQTMLAPRFRTLGLRKVPRLHVLVACFCCFSNIELVGRKPKGLNLRRLGFEGGEKGFGALGLRRVPPPTNIWGADSYTIIQTVATVVEKV